jgi:AAA domain
MSISHRRKRRWLTPDDREKAEYLAQTQGGEVDDWIEKLMPVGKEFDDKDLLKAGYELITCYDYMTPEGHVLYQVCRYQHRYVKKEKAFPCRHRDPDSGTWLFGRGRVAVAYRWRDLAAKPDADVFVCEGEKDADRLSLLGLLSTTVAGQNWNKHATGALRDRNVFILEDNDEDGRVNALASAEVLQGVAKSIRIVSLPGLGPEGDVSEWLEAGHTKDELVAFAEAQPIWGTNIAGAKAYDFPTEETIARYEWLLGKHLLRGEVSVTAAMGGTGKSSLAIVEALAMTSGKKLLHDDVPDVPLKVVLVNLEDKRNTMEKRIAAAMRHYNLTKEDVGERLIVVAKGEAKIKIAKRLRSGDVWRNEETIKDLTTLVKDNQADVLSIDSFIRTHGVNENDNSAIQSVVECFEDVAGPANCAVHLWHHTRKMGGERASVEALRGAQAFIDAGRSIRILETMTRKERDDLVAIAPSIGEPSYYFRAFNGKRRVRAPESVAVRTQFNRNSCQGFRRREVAD